MGRLARRSSPFALFTTLGSPGLQSLPLVFCSRLVLGEACHGAPPLACTHVAWHALNPPELLGGTALVTCSLPVLAKANCALLACAALQRGTRRCKCAYTHQAGQRKSNAGRGGGRGDCGRKNSPPLLQLLGAASVAVLEALSSWRERRAAGGAWAPSCRCDRCSGRCALAAFKSSPALQLHFSTHTFENPGSTA